MSVILPQIPARLRRVLGRFVGPAGAALFSLVLASCAGGGFGGASDTPAVNPASQPAPAASGPISPASQRNVAEALSGLKLGDETPPISPEDIAVSDDAEILNRNPFSSSSPAARASGWGARADSTRKTQGYKAFEVAVPSENPLMTVAVWISETPPDYPEGKPEQDPESDRKFLYLRLQVFIEVGHVALVEGGGIEVLDSEVIVVEEKRPDPKPQPKPQPVTLEAVTAETVCESGSLSTNGLAQAELDAGLISAAEDNDLEGACEYLRRGANVDARESGRYYKRTALMIATTDGRLELAKLLYANGADVNLAGGNHDGYDVGRGWTALQYSGAAGRPELAGWLLDSGAELNSEWVTGKTALWEAAYWGRPDVVKLLLSRGAETNGGGALLHAAVLLDEGGWVSARRHWANGPAFRYKRNAISYSYPTPTADEHGQVVSLLLSHDAEVNARYQGRSPLDYAARQGDERLSAMLRDAGGICYVETGPLCGVAEVATPDPVTLAVTAETVCESGSLSANGLTQAELDAGLLSAAAENDLPGACEYLRRGADVDARESGRYHKRTALMIAANDGFLDLAKLLHANGADVNLHGGSHDGGLYGRGWSALHYSAVAGNVEIARWLLDAGAELESTWDGVKTALWEASYWGRPGVVELLLSRGADVSRSPGDLSGIRAAVRETTVNYPYTRTMLSYYYPKPSADSLLLVVSLLAAGGAELNERRRGGRSILDEAVNRNNARVAKVLRQFGGKCFLATGPLCGVAEVVTAETVCESGLLSANGQTQAQLDAGLISAAKANDLPGTCEYLRRGADVEAREVSQRFRRTALMIAAGEGFLELAKLLHGNGADVDRQAGNHRGGHNDSPGWTALHYAATAGHADMVSWLLDSGADMDARWGWGGIPGKSVLWEAAHWGRADVVELLLSRGADPEGGGSPLPLHGALWKLFGGGSAPWDFVMVGYSREELDSDSYVAVVSLLASRVPDVNRRVNGKSALDVAVHENQSRLAAVLRGFGGKCFVQTGPLCGVVPVATPDPVTLEAVTAETVCESGSLSANGQTQAQLNAGLISAAKANNLANACEYLRRGASPDSRESRGVFNRTALMIAASDGRLDLAKLLHGNGADVNQQKGQMNHWAYASPGWSALIYAATAGHADMVSWLLDSGADIEAYWHSPGKKTALWEAAFWGRADVVEILLSRGGNPDRSDASDAFPLHGGASKNGWGGASTPSNVVMFGYSRMGAGDAVKVVSLLAAAVSDVNALENGRTALDVAASQNRPEVAAVLRNAGGECLVETGPLCPIVEVATAETVTVTAETVCESGSLSANGLTQAWLDAKLVSAAKANNLAGVCEYLRRGASPDSRESRGVFNRTALMIAASDGRLDLAKLLHGNGADVNQQKGQMNHWAYASPGWSALIYAATAGHADLVSWLLDSGADIEAYWHSPGKKTALWEAAFWGRADVVEILLSRGGNPDRSDASDAFPLHGGASKNGWGGASTPSNVVMFGYSRMGAGDAVNVVSLLAAAVSDVNALENGRTALDVAASQNRPEVAAVLRNAGGECLVETGPLCPVVEVVTAETVTVTAETVCESGSLSANGQTQAQLDAGLISAAKANNLANACEYLRRGASPDSRESRGVFNRTALMIAASDGRLDLAKLLHANGADVNQQKGQMNHWAYASPGWSALIYAATAGHADMVSWLLDSGADIEAYWHSPGKKTALWEAAHWGRADVIGILLSHGADPDRSDASDAFPLHGGAGKLWGGAATPSNVVMVGYSRMGEDEAVNVVSLLAAAVSDVNALENGKTALDLAASQNRPEVAAVLRNAGGKCVVETGPLCPVVEVVTAETVCESGSLSANGQTQAQLDAGLISAAKANDLAKVCEHLRRGADMNARDRFQAPDGLHRRTPLMLAAVDNRLTLAKLLVENGADVNYKSGGPDLERQDGAGWSALMYAAGAGQVETATYLLDQGAEIDMQWASGYSALHEAAIWGRWETAELLIERGANVNLRGYGLGETPLHGASWGSNRRHFTSTRPSSRVSWNKVITALLAGGADVNARGNDDLDALPSRLRFDRVGGESPLDTLVLHHNKSQRAAKLRDAGGYCYVQTSSLCAYPPVAEADSLECPAGTLPTNGLTTAELNMTLRMAARGGDATRVCEALKRGAEVNDNLDDSEFTPLQEAVSGGHLEAVKVLLANGAEVNKRKDGAGHSPLDLAARDGEAEIAALLRNANGRCFVETGPLCQSVPVATPDPVTVVNTVAATVASTVAATVANTVVAEVENTVASTVAAGSCPAGTLPTNGLTQAQLDYEFLGAVLENDLEGACEYLRQGANIEIREDEVGRPYNLSALMIAAGRGGYNYPDMTRLLLANGAKTDARDGSGWVTALHYAAASGHTETAALILDWGGDVNVLSSGGDPSLYQAAHWGRADMVQLLLSRGADPDIQANTGVTPLHGAASNVARSGSAAVVSLLLSYDADPNLRRSRSNPGLITRAGETGHSPLDDLVARGYGNYAEAARILRDAGGKCFVRTGPLCQNVPVATPDPVTVVNTVAATVASTIVATVANTVVAAVENTVAATVAAGSCPAGTLDANGLTQAQLDQAMLDAVEDRDVEEVCEYLRRGANVGAYSETEYPGLVLVQPNDVDMAKLLLENGADPNQRKSILHAPPLWFEAKGVEIIRLYLSYGADPNLGSDPRQSSKPLHHAAYYNNWRVMEALLEFGAEPNVRDTKPGWRMSMPLHFVFDGTRTNSDLAVSVLLSGGADVNALDGGGNSALDLAVRDNNAAAAQVLRDAGGQCFARTGSLCGSAPAPAAAAESAPATDRLRESFAGAFNPSPAFGDAFGAASGSSERFLSRLDSLMRSTSGSGGNVWDSFAGWQRENEHGRMWFSTGQRGDFGFGAGVGGAGGDLSASPFAAMVGNGMLAGGETGLGAAGKLRIAAFADYQARSLLDGTDRQWTKWAASGTAIETAMTEAERFSGLAENQTRGAMTEIHLGGGDLGVALQAGAVSESDAMLSGTADDEHLRGLRARTAFAGLSGAADLFGSGWRLRGSAHLGRSWAESERMLRDGDLWASAFSAGLERGGWLYSDDGFILRFSQPLRVESLEMDLIGADGASRLGADPSGRQLDVDAAYRLPLSGGGWLLLSAGVRRDGGHTSSSDLEAGALFSVERGF